MFTVREASPNDAAEISELWASYMREAYDRDNTMTRDVIRRDAFGANALFTMSVATGSDGAIWGCIAWHIGYDLHHAIRGVLINDFYVYPKYRGFGVAPSMAAFVAAAGAESGASFLRGHVATNDPARRLYDRVAVYFEGADANVGGRAFRHLAGLAGKSPRQIAQSLPERDWNYE